MFELAKILTYSKLQTHALNTHTTRYRGTPQGAICSIHMRRNFQLGAMDMDGHGTIITWEAQPSRQEPQNLKNLANYPNPAQEYNIW